MKPRRETDRLPDLDNAISVHPAKHRFVQRSVNLTITIGLALVHLLLEQISNQQQCDGGD